MITLQLSVILVYIIFSIVTRSHQHDHQHQHQYTIIIIHSASAIKMQQQDIIPTTVLNEDDNNILDEVGTPTRPNKRRDMKPTPSRQPIRSSNEVSISVVGVESLSISSVSEIFTHNGDDANNQESDRYMSPNDVAWNVRIKLLAEFKAGKGHCRVPRKYQVVDAPSGEKIILGSWLDNMKTAHRQNKLLPERYAKLIELGVHFSSPKGCETINDDPAIAIDSSTMTTQKDETDVESKLYEESNFCPPNMYPEKIEQLVNNSIANVPSLRRDWMTEELNNEVKELCPKESDIDQDGYRDVDSLFSSCEQLFPVDRRFCSVRQLEAAIHEFSNSWGFTSSRYGKDYLCHYAIRKAADRQISMTTTSTKKTRSLATSVKDKTNCPFFIRFSVNKRRSLLPHWALGPEGKLRHSDCCPLNGTMLSMKQLVEFRNNQGWFSI